MSERVSVNAIGKCPVKGCRSRVRHTFAGRVVRDRTMTRTDWGMPTRWGVMWPGQSMFGGNANRASTYPTARDSDAAWVESMYAHEFVCEEHDRFHKVAAVNGVVNEDKGCDGRCEAATGPNCECQCGGANHGAAYA